MKTLKLVLLILISLNLVSCLDEVQLIGSDNFCPGRRQSDGSCPSSGTSSSSGWEFSSAANYIYDSNFVEVSSGRAALKTIDTNFSGSDFSTGTHVGTELANEKLKLKRKPSPSEMDVNTILPSVANNLVGYWRMENDSWADSSSSGYNAVPAAAGTKTVFSSESLVSNYSGEFESTKLSVSGSNLDPSGGELSYSVWLNPNFSASGTRLVLGSSGGSVAQRYPSLYVRYSTGSHYGLHWGVGDGGSWCGPGVNDVLAKNEWSHVVVTFKTSDGFNIFVNGENVSSGTCSGKSPFPSTGLNLFGQNYEGYADELAIWRTQLQESDVKKLFEGQKKSYTELFSDWVPHYSDIVGYWKMDGNWQDSSGNSNHGTVASGSPSFSNQAKIGMKAGKFSSSEMQTIHVTNPTVGSETTRTISAWFKVETLPSVQTYYPVMVGGGVGRAWLFQISSSGTLSSNTYWGSSCDFYLHHSSPIFINHWYHVAITVNRSGSFKQYLNGELINSTDISSCASSVPFQTGGNYIFGARSSTFLYDGYLDDIAIWNKELSEGELNLIYNRQKQKYSASYESPVIDLESSQTIEKLSHKLDQAFMKELTTTSESTSDYTSMSGDLSNGLTAYYPLNEDQYTGATDEVLDKSGNLHHGAASGTASSGIGILGAGSPIGRGISVPAAKAPTISDNFTISFWMMGPNEIPSGYHTILTKGSPAGNLSFLKIQGRNHDKRVGIRLATNGTSSVQPRTETEVLDGQWHHIAFVSSGSSISVYVDGKLERNEGFSIAGGSQVDDPTSDLAFGGSSFPFFKMDEVAIWGRPLSANEIQQLYRRSANRIKYQVRACTDSTCSTDPEWKGPGGDDTTYFSELYNRSSSDLASMISTCSTSGDNLCSLSELSFSGATKASALNFNFSDSLINNKSPLSARYFQYRVVLEAEDNTACSNEACLPNLISAHFETGNEYYSHSPSIVSKNPTSISGVISKLEESVSGTCSTKYQFSKDGTNFFYYNSGRWESATDTSSEANTVEQISSKLKDFVNKGSLYFKAYLVSSGAQSCEIQKLTVTQ